MFTRLQVEKNDNKMLKSKEYPTTPKLAKILTDILQSLHCSKTFPDTAL